jgi:hypothetical protein
MLTTLSLTAQQAQHQLASSPPDDGGVGQIGLPPPPADQRFQLGPLGGFLLGRWREGVGRERMQMRQQCWPIA